MKLLLKMNVLPQLAPRMVVAGHLCRHARDVGLERAGDPEIINTASAGGGVEVETAQTTGLLATPAVKVCALWAIASEVLSEDSME